MIVIIDHPGIVGGSGRFGGRDILCTWNVWRQHPPPAQHAWDISNAPETSRNCSMVNLTPPRVTSVSLYIGSFSLWKNVYAADHLSNDQNILCVCPSRKVSLNNACVPPYNVNSPSPTFMWAGNDKHLLVISLALVMVTHSSSVCKVCNWKQEDHLDKIKWGVMGEVTRA